MSPTVAATDDGRFSAAWRSAGRAWSGSRRRTRTPIIPTWPIRDTPRVSTQRARELWRHRETGELYIVEVEGDRVVAASGPVTEDQVREDALAYKHAAQGRTPAYDEETADIERRRDEFDREPLPAPD
jgi:hypothetical protein